MTVERRYLCNVCRETIQDDPAGGFRGIGLHWTDHEGWIRGSWARVENHICFKCASSIQSLPEICGQGFECDGGIKCLGNHR